MTGLYAIGEVATGSTQDQAGTPPVSTVTSVTVTPSTATILGGATFDFDWVIAGTNSPSQAATVTTSLGTISAAGVVTAPAATSSAQTGTVTVTSTQDSTKSGTATFTVAAVQVGDTTGPVMQGAISFTKTSTTNDLSWPAATDASGIGEYFVSKDGGAPVSTGLTRSKSFGGLSPSTQHQYVVTANDIYGNPSSNSLTVTVQTDESSATYATYIEETFVDAANVPRGSLSGMRWYVWAEVGATPLGAPIAQGIAETTDVGGVSRVDISGQTSVMPGATVRLGFTNDNGSPTQEGLFSWFGTVLAH